MKIILLLFGICYFSLANSGEVQFPPLLTINPNVIDTNTNISAGFDLHRCMIPSANYFVESENNEINIYIQISSIFPCTVLPVAEYYYYDLGKFEEGEYNLTFYDVIAGQIPIVPNDPNITAVQIDDPITFEVYSVKTVPTTNFGGLIIILVVMMIVATFKIKQINIMNNNHNFGNKS